MWIVSYQRQHHYTIVYRDTHSWRASEPVDVIELFEDFPPLVFARMRESLQHAKKTWGSDMTGPPIFTPTRIYSFESIGDVGEDVENAIRSQFAKRI